MSHEASQVGREAHRHRLRRNAGKDLSIDGRIMKTTTGRPRGDQLMRTRATMKLAVALTAARMLAACSSSQTVAVQEPAVARRCRQPSTPIRSSSARGVASYQNAKDQVRNEAAARNQCKLPYVIKAGAAGGVVMHLADEATPQDLVLKGSPGGKSIGPPGPAGREKDREIISVSSSILVTRFVDSGCRHPVWQHGLRPLRVTGRTPAARIAASNPAAGGPTISRALLSCMNSLGRLLGLNAGLWNRPRTALAECIRPMADHHKPGGVERRQRERRETDGRGATTAGRGATTTGRDATRPICTGNAVDDGTRLRRRQGNETSN